MATMIFAKEAISALQKQLIKPVILVSGGDKK